MLAFKKLNLLDTDEIQKFIFLRKKAQQEWYSQNIFIKWADAIDREKIDKKNFFLLKEDSVIIGYLNYKNTQQEKIKHNFYIFNVYIDSDKQWYWFWKILLTELETHLIHTYKLPLIAIHMNVTETNIKAIRLYQKMWYETIWVDTTKIVDNWAYIWSYLMKKTIMGSI